jgi:hypothetical protein
MKFTIASLFGLLVGGDAFAFTKQVGEFSRIALSMSMKPTYEALSSKVVEKLGLQATDFTESYNVNTWSCPTTGITGTSDWLSEASPKYLTGVSLCTRANGDGTNEQLTVNVWMGPSYDVPHLLMTFGEESNGRYAVTADYVVRGDTPIGSNPQYINMFYGGDVTTAWTGAYSTEGSQPLAPQGSFEERLLASPARIAVGGLSRDVADGIVSDHLDRFLAWVNEAQPIPARSRGSMNLRDDKLRQYFYRGEVTRCVKELGDDLGSVVAAGNTGPTAESYVGGGS